MSTEKVQYSVGEALSEQEHRKILSKRIEDVSNLMYNTYSGLRGYSLSEKKDLISYKEARVNIEEIIRALTPLIKSLEEGERVFDASKVAGGKR